MQVQFGLLGPLYARSGQAVIGIPAARQRVVLAALAVQAGQVVSVAELARIIWDDAPPARAPVAVRNYVCRLRQCLGLAGGRIVTCAPGYRLEADDDDVDLLAFTRLCREAGAAVRAGAWQRASDALGEALALWRGAPLADVPSRVLRDAHVPVLESLRLQASEWCLEAGLRLGRHGELVPQLEGLVREHPLREGFRAQLMLALYRCGRQGEALAAYASARGALVTELGVEPGPELQALHRRILAADPGLLAGPPPVAPPAPGQGEAGGAAAPRRPVPRQLPAGPRHFVGREREMSALNRQLAEVGGPPGTVVISAIDGIPGVGKTALAVCWAHRVAEQFPDGQLYVNLRGFDPSSRPTTPGEAIRGFLHGFGVPPERIPASTEAQAALYRTLTAGKRLLVVLDNARDADQVWPLLPGSPGCLVLVTSRARLLGLVAAYGTHLLALDLPSRSEARGLLAGRLGLAAMAAEPQAADELIRLCARLPLALGLAAARAAARPGFPLATLAAELRETTGRLDALNAGNGGGNVRAVFSWSLQGLCAPAARMFRLLSVHPGPDISVPAAASLAGVPWPQARAVLRELVDGSLVTERAPGRYTLHDLLRVYAAEQAAACETDEDRRAAACRMLDHYLHSAGAAARAVEPDHDLPPDGPLEPGVTPEVVTGRDQSLAWFDAEHKVILEVIGRAAEARFDARAQQMSWTLVMFYDRSGRWHDLAASQYAALGCAQRLADLDGQARAYCNLGRAHIRLGETDRTRAHLGRAVELYRRLGDRAGEARAYLSLSVVFEHEGRLRESLSASLQALELAAATGSPVLQAKACNNTGFDYARLGEFRRALGYCRLALSLAGQADSPSLAASIWDSLGYVHHQLGDHREAAGSYLQAVALFRGLGARYQCASALSGLGDAYRAAGDGGAARDAWQQALTILDDLGHHGAGQVRAKLDRLGAHGP